MDEINDIPTQVDERTERLICRVLDAEASVQERAELASRLVADPAARALFDEYQQNDRLAAMALRREIASVRPVRVRSRHSGLRLGISGALLTAAAVVAISFMQNWWIPAGNPSSGGFVGPPVPFGPGAGLGGQSQMIRSPASPGYLDIDHQPVRRLRDVQQDLILVPSKNQDQIYIFERDGKTTRLVPVSGDI